jgi:hypothetical protein
MVQIVWRKLPPRKNGVYNIEPLFVRVSKRTMYALRKLRDEEKQRLGTAPSNRQILEQMLDDTSLAAQKVRQRMYELQIEYDQAERSLKRRT